MTDTTTKHSVKKAFLPGAAKIVLPCLLGGLCLYYILVSFRWAEIWLILRRTDVLTFLVGSVAATLAFWFLRAVRWAYLLRGEQLAVSFFKLYLYTAVTVGFANFTPFQSGEALKVELFRKYGAARLSGYAFFFFEKLLDLAVIALLSLIGIYALFDKAFAENTTLVIVGLFVALIIAAATIFFLAQRWQAKISAARREVLPDVKTFAVAFLLTSASWAAMIAGWKYILQSGGISLSVLQTTAVISLTTVVSIVSLVPGAIGVSELSIAALLSQIGYETSIAQTGALLVGIYSLVILLLAVVHLILLKAIDYAAAKRRIVETN